MVAMVASSKARAGEGNCGARKQCEREVINITKDRLEIINYPLDFDERRRKRRKKNGAI